MNRKSPDHTYSQVWPHQNTVVPEKQPEECMLRDNTRKNLLNFKELLEAEQRILAFVFKETGEVEHWYFPIELTSLRKNELKAILPDIIQLFDSCGEEYTQYRSMLESDEDIEATLIIRFQKWQNFPWHIIREMYIVDKDDPPEWTNLA